MWLQQTELVRLLLLRLRYYNTACSLKTSFFSLPFSLDCLFFTFFLILTNFLNKNILVSLRLLTKRRRPWLWFPDPVSDIFPLTLFLLLLLCAVLCCSSAAAKIQFKIFSNTGNFPSSFSSVVFFVFFFCFFAFQITQK